MHRLRRSTLSIAVAAAACAMLAPAASAAGPVFSITPIGTQPYFIFNGATGGTLTGQVRIVNVSNVAGQGRLFAVDATTGQTSGAVYQSTAAPRHDVGRWVSLSTGTVTLGPHTSTVVSFTVHVPRGSTSGQHLGGLVIAPVVPTSTQTSHHGTHAFRVNIQEISIVAVQVNLPGRLSRRLAIGSVQAAGRPGYQVLTLNIASTGNALLKGSGALKVLHAGRKVVSQAFALDTILPGTTIAFPVYVRGPRLAPGAYQADVTVAVTGGARVHRLVPFTISQAQVRQTYGTAASAEFPGGGGPRPSDSSFPVWLIVLGGVALVGASVGGSAFFFRRRPPGRAV